MKFDNFIKSLVNKISYSNDEHSRLKDINSFFKNFIEKSKEYKSFPERLYPSPSNGNIDWRDDSFFKIKYANGNAQLTLKNHSFIVANKEESLKKTRVFIELWEYLLENKLISENPKSPNEIEKFRVPLIDKTYEVGPQEYNHIFDNLWLLVKEYVMLEISPTTEFEYFISKNFKLETKQNRKKINQTTQRLLQKEIHSTCPFCPNTDVAHFQVHHIDENNSNNEYDNLILLCPNCHSKITKGDIKAEDVRFKKSILLITLQ